MARQASGIRAEMIAMRNSLTKFTDGRTTGWMALGHSLNNLIEKWDAYDDNYESLVGFAAEVESVTEEQLRADAEAHQTFQSDLMILRDEVQVVLDNGQEAAVAQENARDKDKRIKQMGDRFKAAYDGIDAVLTEMKTSLGDEAMRFSLDLLEYQSGRLETLEKQIEIADSVAQAMTKLDLEQSIVTADNKEKR